MPYLKTTSQNFKQASAPTLTARSGPIHSTPLTPSLCVFMALTFLTGFETEYTIKFVSKDEAMTWSLSSFHEMDVILDVWNAHLEVTSSPDERSIKRLLCHLER